MEEITIHRVVEIRGKARIALTMWSNDCAFVVRTARNNGFLLTDDNVELESAKVKFVPKVHNLQNEQVYG